MAGARQYQGPVCGGWDVYAPNDVPTMTRDEALAILNNENVTFVYAKTGRCPKCGREQQGDQYPHNTDCPFAVALMVAEANRG